MPIARTAKDLLREPLPDLNIGENRTNTSALHPIKFVGKLQKWINFKIEVFSTCSFRTWKSNIIRNDQDSGPNLPNAEYIRLGDETGLQGRFHDRVGHVINTIAHVEGLDCVFSDSKCDSVSHKTISDFITMGNRHNSNVKIVGELKTPWIKEHSLRVSYQCSELGDSSLLRQLLGQIARYMQKRGAKYGIITNYRETIFLRQSVHHGQWTLEYSPVILYSYVSAHQSVTMRMCFMHVVIKSLDDSRFETGGLRTQNSKWTKNIMSKCFQTAV